MARFTRRFMPPENSLHFAVAYICQSEYIQQFIRFPLDGAFIQTGPGPEESQVFGRAQFLVKKNPGVQTRTGGSPIFVMRYFIAEQPDASLLVVKQARHAVHERGFCWRRWGQTGQTLSFGDLQGINV